MRRIRKQLLLVHVRSTQLSKIISGESTRQRLRKSEGVSIKYTVKKFSETTRGLSNWKRRMLPWLRRQNRNRPRSLILDKSRSFCIY